MKKQILIVGIIVILITIGLSGCTSKSDEEKLIGTWMYYEPAEGMILTAYYTFFSDKTFELVGFYNDVEEKADGIWNIKDGELIISSADFGLASFDYTFSNNDKTLTLSETLSGAKMIFTKQ
jgi:hypothetical protein